MPPRKSKRPVEDNPLGELAAAVEAPQSPNKTNGTDGTNVPALLEYKPYSSLDLWRVSRFEMLVAEVVADGLQPEDRSDWPRTMARFQETVEQYTRGWLMLRLIFGVMPLRLPENARIEDYQLHTREEVCTRFQITKEQLQTELDALRVIWVKSREQSARSEQPEAPSAPKIELEFEDSDFRRFGFSEEIFKVAVKDPITKEEKPRPAAEVKVERDWFMKRVTDWSRMLADPMAGAVARQTLMNELYLRRMETAMSMVMPGTDEFNKLNRVKGETETAVAKGTEKLATMFPDLNTNRSVVNTFFDLITAAKEYNSKGENFRLDGIRTIAEIAVELRQSEQKPEVQYRHGATLYQLEASHNLYSPEWRSVTPQSVWKKLDAGFRKGAEESRVALAETLVNLEDGVEPGEGSQFPDLPEIKLEMKNEKRER